MLSPQEYLQRAFEIAKKVDPHATAPNPRVGCVVVRGGEIISEGVHEICGGAHAEVNAIGDLDLSGCEVFVTLEPCDHFAGKQTPSCTQLLINKKPKESLDWHFRHPLLWKKCG